MQRQAPVTTRTARSVAATRDRSFLSPPADEHEALLVLADLAHGRTGSLAPKVVARHVLAVTLQADWPVQHAALEALIRRVGFARRDELRVASRPPEKQSLGAFTTRPRRGSPRPYATLLTGVDPLAGSCDCPDYLRSSLGLCKHLLCALDWVFATPRRLARAHDAQRTGALELRPHLGWDAVRPLTGEGDWLERVRWRDGAALSGRPSRLLKNSLLLFRDGRMAIAALRSTRENHLH